MPLGPQAVVGPALGLGKVSGQGVIIAAQVMRPADPEGVQNEAPAVQMAMARADLARLEADEGCVRILPTGAEGDGVGREKEVVPVGPRK